MMRWDPWKASYRKASGSKNGESTCDSLLEVFEHPKERGHYPEKGKKTKERKTKLSSSEGDRQENKMMKQWNQKNQRKSICGSFKAILYASEE